MKEGTQLWGCLFLPGLSGGGSGEQSTRRPSGLSRINPAQCLRGCSALAGAAGETGSSKSPNPAGLERQRWRWCRPVVPVGRTRRLPRGLR